MLYNTLYVYTQTTHTHSYIDAEIYDIKEKKYEKNIRKASSACGGKEA